VSDLMRIGELAARTGLSIDRIRAWERRYGIVAPARSPGGFRLYTDDDLRALLAMRDLVAAGVPAAEAARRVRSGGAGDGADRGGLLAEFRARLRSALDAWNESEAQVVIDEALATFDLETLVERLFVPYLQELGERWASGEVTVAHEHFASSVVRGRLMAVARGWDRGFGPRLVLACVPGELHDLPLVMFGLLARRRGWRITFLGADTPLPTAAAARAAVAPAGLVLAASTEERFLAIADELGEVASGGPLALGGRGASQLVAETVGTPVLPQSLAEAADELRAIFDALLPARAQ